MLTIENIQYKKKIACRFLSLFLVGALIAATVLPFVKEIRPAYALENEQQESRLEETAVLMEEAKELNGDLPESDNPTVNYAGSAIIQAFSDVYETGEIIRFELSSKYATPSVQEENVPAALKFEIKLPGAPFEFLHNGADIGEGKYRISIPNGSGLHIIYDSVDDTVSYSLEPGQTLGAILSFTCPNGTTKSGESFALTPVWANESDAAGIENFTVQLAGSSTTVTAGFAWEGPEKTVTEYGKAVLLGDKGLPSFTVGTNLTYTITAANLQKDKAAGVVFTDSYTVTDTMSLNNMYFDVSSAALEGDGTNTITIGGIELLEVDKTGAEVTPIITDDKITGFAISYTLDNTAAATADMGDLIMKVHLFGKDANAYFGYNPAPVEDAAYRIDNDVEFEAWSVHWESHEDDADHYYAKTAGKNIEAEGSVSLAKAAAGTYGPDGTVTYTVTFTNNDKLYSELWISDLLPIKRTGVLGDVFTNVITDFSVTTTGAGISYTDNSSWDTVEEKPQLSTPQAYVDGAYNAAGAKLLYMTKKFENVPVGATITITYSVKLTDGFELAGANRMHNYAFATSGNDLLNGGTELKNTSAYIDLSTEKDRITINKTMVDERGAAISNRRFVKGDIVYYKISITNSGSDVTAEWLREHWPFAGIELQSIDISSGASWDSAEVYNSADDEFPAAVNDISNYDWSQHSTSDPKAAFIQFNDFVIPGSSTTTLLLKGMIIDEGSYPNKVEIKFKNTSGTGNGVSGTVSINTTLLGVSAFKDVYRIPGNGWGGYTWPDVNSLISDKTGHKIGDIIAYGIDVSNNSTDETLIMDKIAVTDSYDEKLNLAGLEPCPGTLNGGTGGSATGVVIARLKDGSLISLSASASSDLTGNSYYIDSANGKISMQIEGANLLAGTDDKLSFYIFFKVTDALGATLTGENSYVLNNAVTVTGESLNLGENHPAETTAGVRHIVDIPNNLRAASVYKSVLGVGSTLIAYNKNALGAMKDKYIFYELKLINNSPDGSPLTVYAIHDVLPEGTEFAGVTEKENSAKVGIGSGKTIKLNTYNSVSGSSAIASAVVDISCEGGVLTITPSSAQSIVEVSGKDSYVNLIAVLKVTDDKVGGYLNTGGFTIDDVRVNHGVKGTPSSGTAKVTDSAAIAGPSYGIGIEKKATAFKASSVSPWSNINSGTILDPGDEIRWTITLHNSADSSGAITEYMVTDHLPAEFAYVEGSSKLGSAALADPVQEPVSDGGGNLLYTKLIWNITETTIPAGGSVKLIFESKWADIETLKYGSYHNEAYFLLTNSGHTLSGVTHGEKTVYGGRIAARAGDTVAMMGGYATQSVKSVENITDGSPYKTDGTNNKSASSGGTIMAIAGDTIRYKLNVTSKTTLGALSNVVIIDVLPQKGDIGVVNRAVGRNSQFDVRFSSIPNVGVSVGGGALNSDEYTVLYGYVPANVGALSENDWSGLEVSNGKVVWTTAPQSNSNAIRVALDDSVKIGKDGKVEVAFNAVVAGNTGTATLPESNEIAWNSFGYAYSVGGNNVRLYAEPIKVGVKIPYATINADKTVINPAGENVEADSTPFTVSLMRKTGDGGWEAAPGVRYTRSGDQTVYMTSLNGSFTIRHGESVKLYVPADLAFYKLKEAESSGYQQIYSYTDLSEDTALAGGDDYNVLFVNKLNPTAPSPGEPKPLEIALEAAKTLDGAAPGGVSFTFLLRNSSGTIIDRKDNDASGKISFDKLVFQKEGTYNYTISELAAPDDDSYNYDTAVYSVSIGVIRNGDKFEHTVTYTRNNTAYAGIPLFSNTTEEGGAGGGGAGITLEAHKDYNGHAPTAGAFSFILRDQNDRQIGGSAVNDANGSVRFAPLSFTAEGTYLYRITELNRGVPVINYDISVYEAEVTVTEAGGGLSASVVYFTVNADGSRTPVSGPYPTFYNTSTPPGPDDPDEIIDIGDPDTPGGAWVPDPDNPDEWIFIPDDDSPLADAPVEEYGGTPRTNDTLAATLFASIAVMAAALAGIALLIILPRRKKFRG